MRNLRYDRADYYNTDVAGYARSRTREFARMHEFVEDTGGLESRLNYKDGSFAQACGENSEYWFCDMVNASDRTAKFFLQVAAQPDAAVLINFRNKATNLLRWQQPLAVPLAFLLKQMKKDEMDKYISQLSPSDRLQPGQVLTKYTDAPKLFDVLVLGGIVQRLRDELYTNYTPVVKVVGRRLNSSKAPVHNPEHPYSNEVDVLGVWPDRLLAMRELVTRHTQRTTNSLTHQAMVDYAPVNRLFKGMLCRMALGNADNPTVEKLIGQGLPDAEAECDKLAFQSIPQDMLPSNFDINTGKGQGIYTDGWQGIVNVDDFYPLYDDVVDQDIEALDPRLTRAVSGFGFERDQGTIKGKTNLFHALMNQVALYSTDSDTHGQEKARKLREFVGLHRPTDYIANGRKIDVAGRAYHISDENVLAVSLQSDIENMNPVLTSLRNSLKISPAGQQRSNIEKMIKNVQKRIVRDRKALEQLPVLN